MKKKIQLSGRERNEERHRQWIIFSFLYIIFYYDEIANCYVYAEHVNTLEIFFCARIYRYITGKKKKYIAIWWTDWKIFVLCHSSRFCIFRIDTTYLYKNLCVLLLSSWNSTVGCKIWMMPQASFNYFLLLFSFVRSIFFSFFRFFFFLAIYL